MAESNDGCGQGWFVLAVVLLFIVTVALVIASA